MLPLPNSANSSTFQRPFEMGEVKKVPELRFPEFTNEWENVLLDETTNRGSGHTPSKKFNSYYDGNIKWISLADSNKLDNGLISDTQYRISEDGIKNSSAVVHPKGSVLLSRDAGVGKSAVMGEAMAVSQHFIVWTPKDGVLNNWFLYYKLQILKREFERMAVGSTIKTIGLPYFVKLKVKVPALPEQQKIASFLSAVDAKIAQLSQKKTLLEQYKKGVMQQIFSQQIRFRDDNGNEYPDWEEKKLGDFVNLVHGDGDWILSKDISEDGKFKVVQLGNIGFGKFVRKELKSISETKFHELKCTPIRKGDLLINRMVDGNLYCCIMEEQGDFITSVDVCWIRENEEFDNFFLMSLMLFEQNQHKLLRLSSGSGRVRISKKNLFEKFVFRLPCTTEQTKIANFLSAIDAKIELVNTQLENTQEFKKGLLQKMFV